MHARQDILSPAMAVALVALVFATTGVAGAATGLLPNPLPLQQTPTTYTYSKTFEAAPGEFASAALQCPSGTRLVGGSTASSGSGQHVWSSHPINAAGQAPADQGSVPTGWAGSISQPSGQGGGEVTVYALCQR